MATKEPTLAELQAQRADLEKKIAAAEIGPLEKMLEALNSAAAAELVERLEASAAGLSEGPARQAIVNVRQIVTTARNIAERSLGNARAKANDGATPPEASE